MRCWAWACIAQAITIDTVTVGDPGNAADTHHSGTTGYGSVSYTYNIGKYEVTAGQYTAFLNAVAKTDTYGLYNTDMARCTAWQRDHPQRLCGKLQLHGGRRVCEPPCELRKLLGLRAGLPTGSRDGQKTGAQDATTTERGTYTPCCLK